MSVLSPSKGRPLVVGANHRSSSLTLRDALFVEEGSVPAFLERLRGKGFTQAIILSTCDRVEVQAIDPTGEDAQVKIIEAMAEHGGIEPRNLADQVYQFFGDEAVRHVFSVVASLDSLVIGEPQVFGQVKESHQWSKGAGMIGAEMEALLQAAYAAAKKVRTDTRIGEGPVSIASAAVQVAKDLHGDLSRCTSLLIGGGEMGELVSESLSGNNISRMVVVHPSPLRAESLARTMECHAATYENLAEEMARADILMAALNRRKEQVVTADMVKVALKARKKKPIFIIDAGIPGDVEPSVADIDGAFLYDLNDLEQVAMEGRASREGEKRAAIDIVSAEATAYIKGQAGREAVPALTTLRAFFEAEGKKAIEETGGGEEAEKAVRLLVNRLLHQPTKTLKDMASKSGAGKGEFSGDWQMAEKVIQHLFDLEEKKK